MGKYHQASNNIVQMLQNAISGSYDTPAYWNNTVYYAGPNDRAKSFVLVNGRLIRSGETPNTISWPGANLAFSQGGTQNDAIIWLISPAGQLIAYDAANLSQELWSAKLPAYTKFAIPAVTGDGHVEVGVGDDLVGFGL